MYCTWCSSVMVAMCFLTSIHWLLLWSVWSLPSDLLMSCRWLNFACVVTITMLLLVDTTTQLNPLLTPDISTADAIKFRGWDGLDSKWTCIEKLVFTNVTWFCQWWLQGRQLLHIYTNEIAYCWIPVYCQSNLEWFFVVGMCIKIEYYSQLDWYSSVQLELRIYGTK